MQYFKKNIYLFIVIILFIILCASYILTIPVFEAPDENWHFFYVFYLSKYNKMTSEYNESIPIEQYIKEHLNEGQDPTIFMDEKYMFYKLHNETYMPHRTSKLHPPLYYLIASQIIKPFGVDNIDAEYDYENFWQPNLFIDNKILKDSSPTNSLVLILRLFQIFYGVLVVIFIYKIIKLLSNNKFEKKSVLLLSCIAFLPQFVFLCSYINNDVLSALLGLISIYFVILLFKKDKSYFGLVSIIFAIIALFTKFTTLIIVPITIITFFVWLIIKKKFWVILVFLLIIFFTISAFYFYKDLQEITYVKSGIKAAWNIRFMSGPIIDTIVTNINNTPFINTAKLVDTLKSSVAVFGWMNIYVDMFIYNYFAAYIISGILLFFTNIREYRKSKKSIIFIIISIIFISIYFLLYAIYTGWAQIQGRTMLTGIFIVFILAILGFKTIKMKYRNILYYTLFSCSLFISIFCLYNYIYLSYY